MELTLYNGMLSGIAVTPSCPNRGAAKGAKANQQQESREQIWRRL